MALPWLKPAPNVENATLSPEAQLLFCCARTHIDAQTATRISRLLQEDIDWPHLQALAGRHAVTPLLHHALAAAGPDRVPVDVLQNLGRDYRAASWRSLTQMGELLALLSLFQAAGVDALPYKGPILAATIYGDINLRQSLDLDILVSRHHVVRAGEVLQMRGYMPDSELPSALDGVEHAHAYRQARTGIDVELHWGITRSYFPFPLSFQQLWDARVERTLSGRRVPFSPPEQLLLLLCVHGGKHAWTRLSWIADVAELLRHEPDLDWPRVLAMAHETGSRRMLHLGLFLARGLLDAPLPETVWRQVQPGRAVHNLAHDVRQWLLAPPQGVLGLLQIDLFRLRLRERTRDKAGYVRYIGAKRLRPNESDARATPLPLYLHLLYYLLRPLRLLRQYGLDPLKDVIRNLAR